MKVQRSSTYLFTVVLLCSSLFTGCGSDYEETNTTSGSSASVANGTEACVQEYYKTKVIPEARSCGSCHHSLGAASASALIFPDTSNYSNSTNYTMLKTYVKANPSTIINKLNGVLSHGGGTYSASSIAIMQDFVDFSANVGACVIEKPAPLVSPISIASVKVAHFDAIINTASKVLLGRPATLTETAAVVDEATFDTQLDSYMNDPAFYDWIKFSFNEFLLTDKYSEGNLSVSLLNPADYPNRAWYLTLADKAELEKRTNYGINKAALELIANVVKKDVTFGEILTANYIMVNPYSERSYQTAATGNAYVNNEPLSNHTQEDFREATISVIPHAGILTDVVFLNRFPTTPTNVNRQRAAKVMLWFLDTDILDLANRAITSSDQSEVFTNPTLQNPNCAVCHIVMDPVTGTFKNWDDQGRYKNAAANPNPLNAWPSTSGPIGLDTHNLLDNNRSDQALQWLAEQIVADKRFARSSVKIFYRALTSREVLKEPSPNDTDYVQKMKAYMLQDYILRQLTNSFIQSGLKAKSLIKAIIKSPLFSAVSVTESTDNHFLKDSIGTAQLITPEQLDIKITKLIGYSWTNAYNTTDTKGNEGGVHYLLDPNSYNTLYGGIDSDEITTRPDTSNGVMASIQARMAIEMGCYAAPREFILPNASRKLLKDIDPSMTPTSVASATIIKQKIIFLYQYLLGEQVAIDSEELINTYGLFYSVYKNGTTAIAANASLVNLSANCRITQDPDNGTALATPLTADPNYTVRAWSAVLTHLLGDYKFIYNSHNQ